MQRRPAASKKAPRSPSILPLCLFTGLGLVSACVGTVGSDSKGGPQDPNTPPGTTPPGNGGTSPGAGGSNGGPGGPPPAAPSVTGRTPLRRLTQAQYNNTIKDLLGLDGQFAAGFGLDEDGSGFRSNITSPVSAAQVDKFDQVAAELATKAVAAGVDKIAPCAPPKGTEAACAEEFLRDFGKRVFRRPLTNEELARYRAVYQVGKGATADFAAGVELALGAFLQSPNFLYIPELGVPAGNGPATLDPYEVASRLSYFLTDSMPDADLFAAADGNRLRTSEELAAQATRLLATPRSRAVMVGFFEQWLEIESLGALDKDTQVYPAFNPELRDAMKGEIEAFVDHVLNTGDGRLPTMLTAGFSFPKGPLAGIYGVAARTGAADGTKLDLPPGQRAGIFTLPGIMAMYAHRDQSAPVGRGYLVSDKLLCTTPPPAPDNVEIMVPKPDPNKSTRERFAAHREDPSCATCHALMDPYGLAFEHYDAIGRYRTQDGNKPVDAAGELPRLGPVKDAVEMMQKLAASDEVAACMTRQFFRFAFGRLDGDIDKPVLDALKGGFVRSDQRLPDLITALAGAPAFRQRPALSR
jgi:hypothetical protein